MIDLLQSIYDQTTRLWNATGISPDYIEAMQLALRPKQPVDIQARAKRKPWILLPCLCCQSAGGESHWAEPVAAAWGLLYTAAHILDAVQDNDPPDASWAHLGSSRAINVSSGLIVSVSMVLSHLRRWGIAEAVILGLVENFSHSVLHMCSGQHHDLMPGELSLKEYWHVVETKSGVFFALACRAGARLATDDPERLDNYSQFGHHLGMLIQIKDDIDDLDLVGERQDNLAPRHRRSLPVAYAMSVLPSATRTHLQACLQAAEGNPVIYAEAKHLMESAGAALYLMVAIEQHRRSAEAALTKACSPSPVRDELQGFLDSIAS